MIRLVLSGLLLRLGDVFYSGALGGIHPLLRFGGCYCGIHVVGGIVVEQVLPLRYRTSVNGCGLFLADCWRESRVVVGLPWRTGLNNFQRSDEQRTRVQREHFDYSNRFQTVSNKV